MLTHEQIQTLHQLYYAERWPIRKIERHLRMGWRTIKKYLHQPDQPAVSRTKASKLGPLKAVIGHLLAQDPTVNSSVLGQRIRTIGYEGGHAMLREYARQVRPKPHPRAFVRLEPIPGQRFEVGWGDFGALDYAGDKRTLYAFAGVSREIWYDNLATAVAEHDGRLVRFPPRFFAFAREFGCVPRACNPAAG